MLAKPGPKRQRKAVTAHARVQGRDVADDAEAARGGGGGTGAARGGAAGGVATPKCEDQIAVIDTGRRVR